MCTVSIQIKLLPAPLITTASPSTSASSSAKTKATSIKNSAPITSSAPYMSAISHTPSKDEKTDKSNQLDLMKLERQRPSHVVTAAAPPQPAAASYQLMRTRRQMRKHCLVQREDEEEEREYLLRRGGVRERERGDLRLGGGDRRLIMGGDLRRILHTEEMWLLAMVNAIEVEDRV
ncbi:hypothetical protein E2C01_042566 [Portunus trituberculatus]|uniref:Uncharacterized protein n=1 Tax=Portunus trituberculatus TaxID=210409 RepID=A0A5B7FV09_PORTR|nr:hypothetical protein [Portunus trituberculatus]